MRAEPDDSTVDDVMMPAATATPHLLRSVGGGGPGRLAGLDPAVTAHRWWPTRTALVVGSTLSPVVLTSLERHGIQCCLAAPARVQELLPDVGPFTFLVIDADVLGDDTSVAAVRAWQQVSPGARVLLVSPVSAADPAVLTRALRAGVHDVLDPTDPARVELQVGAGLRQAGAHRERVLAIGAHPDDVEIGCGGTLLDHRRRGDRVSILTLSHGRASADTDARVRETCRTADAIGAQLLLADLPDSRIGAGIDTIRLIESVIRALDPTVVYVHSDHDHHQDHRAVHTATRSATRAVRQVFAYQSPSATNDFTPTQFVPIDGVVHSKVAMLQLLDPHDDRSYLDPDLVIAGSRYWARHLSAAARYAEPFEIIRSVGDLRHAATTPHSTLPGETEPTPAKTSTAP